MNQIDLSFFRSARPKVEPHLLESGEAHRAVNTRLQTGALQGFRGATTIRATSRPTVKSLHRFGDTSLWFEFADDVDVAEGPLPSDTETTTYFTGDGAPAMTYAGLATSGSEPFPTNRYRLGIPAPETPMTVAKSGTPDPNDDSADSRVYVFTFVSEQGEEGPPSPPSSLIDVYDDEQVDISDIPTAPAGNYNITHKRIYRTSTASGDTEYLYVDQIAVGVTTYTDTYTGDELGEVLPSYEWYQPPEDMAGLIACENGVLAGFSGKELCLSEAYLPHAWPPSYRVTMDQPIVGLVAVRGGIVVATQGQPSIVSFTNPAAAAQAEIENPRACVSKRSMVDMGDFALYATADGLVAVDGGGNAPLITASVIDRYEWKRLNPETIHAYRMDSWYIAFYEGQDGNGGFAISANGEGFVELDFYADAGYTDPRDGGLYLVLNDEIVRWDDDDANVLDYLWRSGTYLTRPCNMAWGRVDAEDYPATADDSLVVKLYADGDLKHTQQVTSNMPFPLPAGYLARRFEVEVSGTRTVRRVLMADHSEGIT